MTIPINPKDITWTPPTLNTDGSTIPAGEVTGYTLGFRSATAGTAGTYPITVPVASGITDEPLKSAQTAAAALLKPDTYAAAIRTESTGGPSAWTGEVQFTVTLPVPNAPTNFTIA